MNKILLKYLNNINSYFIFIKIREASYNFDEDAWEFVSEQAKNLIKKMIVIDPNQVKIYEIDLNLLIIILLCIQQNNNYIENFCIRGIRR